eukprot:5086955-Alexandrium_andersonii.AAC.1
MGRPLGWPPLLMPAMGLPAPKAPSAVSAWAVTCLGGRGRRPPAWAWLGRGRPPFGLPIRPGLALPRAPPLSAPSPCLLGGSPPLGDPLAAPKREGPGAS